jgi:hypothetical protein
MKSPQRTTEYFDVGGVHAAITRHGPEDSNDYSAIVHGFKQGLPNAEGRPGAVRWLQEVLTNLAKDAVATAAVLDEKKEEQTNE